MVKPQISFIDFQKLDLRVGKVLTAQNLEKSNKLIKMIVDFGQDYGKKTILGGLSGVYELESLKGKKFAFIANLEPKKMVDTESEGMILAVDKEGKPVLLEVPEDLSEGTVIR